MLKDLFRWTRRPEVPANPWDLGRPLLSWSENDHWTIRDAVEGALIIGSTGSGKSSGPGSFIAKSMLAAGFGGLVLIAKKDEIATWHSYCRATGRLGDLLVFGSGEPLRFDPLDFEMRRAGEGAGQVENLVNLLSTLMEVSDRGTSGGGGREDDGYWKKASRQMTRNMVELLALAKGSVTVPDLYRVAVTAPSSPDHIKSEQWRARCLAEADRKEKSPEQRRDFEIVTDYFCLEWPALAEKTRSIILSTFTSLIDVMNRGLLRSLYCSGTNVTPQVVEEGKIILVALPVKEFGDVGQIAQVLWKYAFQRSIERRDVGVNARPVFLFADEAQSFVTSYDAQFQATSRAARVATVLLTQNVSNFEAALGGSEKGRAETAALFANLNTKLLLCNGDPVTNEWGAKLVGRSLQTFVNSNNSYQSRDWLATALGMGQPSQSSAGVTEAYEFELQPRAFSFLRTGGPDNGMLVDAVLFQNGRRFKATGKNWMHVTFQQVP
jgi:type IV secretory pathway TraG/TraD family ATPase VirD4